MAEAEAVVERLDRTVSFYKIGWNCSAPPDPSRWRV